MGRENELEQQKKKAQSGNVFFTLFAAVALVGAVGATSMGVMRGPMKTMADVSARAMAESQIMANTKLAIISVSQAGFDKDCDKDGTIEPYPWVAGAGPTGGGLMPVEIPTTSTTDPWNTSYGYCVWDHGTAVDDAACGGAGQLRLPGLNTTTHAGGDAGKQTVIAIVSAGPDRVFQTTCRDWASADINGGAEDGDLDDAGDLPLVSAPDSSDDIIMQYTYAEAALATSSNWKVKDDATNVAEIEEDKVEASGEVQVGGSVSTAGLKLASDPGDNSKSGICGTMNNQALRLNTGTIPATLEICNGSAWQPVTGSLASGSSSSSCQISAIDHRTHISAASNDIQIAGDYAYTVFDGNSFTVINISDPLNPYIANGGTATFNDAKLQNAHGITLNGNYAYVSAWIADTFSVIDISDPANPAIANSGNAFVTDGTKLNGAIASAISGNYAYVVGTTGDRVTVIDISDPLNPVIANGGNAVVHDATKLNGAQEIAISGNYAYVAAASNDSITVIDISDPLNPVIANGGNAVLQDSTKLDIPYDIAIKGNYAYVASHGSNSMTVIDISDPLNPVIANSGEAWINNSDTTGTLMNGAWRIAIEDNYAFVAGAFSDRINVIDISDPLNPVWITAGGIGAFMNRPEGIAISGGYAFASGAISGTFAVLDFGCNFDLPSSDALGTNIGYDVNNPNCIANESGPLEPLDTLSGNGASSGIWGDGTYIYVAHGGAVRAYTFNGHNFTEVASGLSSSRDLWGDDTYLYVSRGYAGVSVLTFDGTSFTTVDTLASLGDAQGIWSDGDYIYVGSTDGGVRALSFDGTDLTLLDTAAASFDVRDVWSDGEYIYIVTQDNGVRVYDFDGTSFTLLDSDLPSGWGTQGTHITGGNGYIFASEGGNLHIYTFDGTHLTLTNTEGVGFVHSLFHDGNALYRGGTNFFTIYDYDGIRDTIASEYSPSTHPAIWSDGTYVYVNNSVTGLRAYGGVGCTRAGDMAISQALEEDFTTNQLIVRNDGSNKSQGSHGASVQMTSNEIGDEAGVSFRIDSNLSAGEMASAIISGVKAGLNGEGGLSMKVNPNSGPIDAVYIDPDGDFGLGTHTGGENSAVLQIGDLPGDNAFNADHGNCMVANSEALTQIASADDGGRSVWSDGEYIYTDNYGRLAVYKFDGTDLTQLAWDSASSNNGVGNNIWGDGTYIYQGGYNPRAYTFDGTTLTRVGNQGWPGGQLLGQKRNGQSYIFTLDGTNDRIAVMQFDGTDFNTIDRIDINGEVNSQWTDGEYIYVTDSTNDAVYAISFDGTELSHIATLTIGVDFVGEVWGANGYIFINADWMRVYTFDGKTFTRLDNSSAAQFHHQTWHDGVHYFQSGGNYLNTHSFNGRAFESRYQQFGTNQITGVWGDGTYLYSLNMVDVTDALKVYSGVECLRAQSGSKNKRESLLVARDENTATETKIAPSDGGASDSFGKQQAIAIEGNYAIIGSFGDDDVAGNSGAVYVYDITTGTELRKLIPGDSNNNAYFGDSVGLHDGIAIIGAYGDNDMGSGAGAAFLFDIHSGEQIRKLTASDATAGDNYGTSVDINEKYIIVGASLRDDTIVDEGIVYIYDRITGTELYKLSASDVDAGDTLGFNFGDDVSLSGDYALVSAPRADISGSRNAGAAYLYDLTDGSEVRKFVRPTGPFSDSSFAFSSDMDGEIAVFGHRRTNIKGPNEHGVVYVFNILTGHLITTLTTNDPQYQDNFGEEVAIDGHHVIAGARYEDTNGSNSGAAYVLDLRTGEQLAKLLASDGADNDWFGYATAINGGYAIVGARQDDDNGSNSGSAYIFNLNLQKSVYFGTDGNNDANATVFFSDAFKIKTTNIDASTTADLVEIKNDGIMSFFTPDIHMIVGDDDLTLNSQSETRFDSLLLRKAQGTKDVPYTIENGDIISALTFAGQRGGGISANGNAAIYARVNGAVTSTMNVDLHFNVDDAGDAASLISTSCPSGWTYNDGSCYLFSSGTDTLANAQSACSGENGRLVTISSAEENSYITGQIASAHWIGATDTATEGQFLWADGSQLSYSNWASGQPDDNGGAEDTAEISAAGEWSDNDGTGSLDYICEKPADANSDMVITSAGNLGVAKTNPTERIDVNGRITFDEGLKIGNDTSCSSSADDGVIRMNSGALEVCDGAGNWTNITEENPNQAFDPYADNCISNNGGPFVEVASITASAGNGIGHFWLDDDYLYAILGAGGFAAFSFDGTSFTELDRLDPGTQADIWGDGTYIYVRTSQSEIRAYTFDGNSFTQAGNSYTFTSSGYANIWGDGDYIYVASTDNGVRALTFDGTNFSQEANLNFTNNIIGVWGDGTYIYVTEQSGHLRALKFTGDAFYELDDIDVSGGSPDISGDENYIYVASANDTVHAYTFDGITLTEVGARDLTGGSTFNIWADSGYVFTGDLARHAAFYFDGATFNHLGSVGTGTNHRGAIFDGQYVFLATDNRVIRAYTGFECLQTKQKDPEPIMDMDGILKTELKITASDGGAGDAFGSAVAIDGNYAVIGASGDDDNGSDAGAAYIFDVTTGTELFKLTASDGISADSFGASVAIDGNYAVIGARQDDDNGTNSGSAYVFDVTTGTELFKLTASDGAANDWFATSVAIDGHYALISAVYDDDNGTDSGSAYVFDVTTGTQLHKLTASDGAANDYFGTGKLDGNYAVIAAQDDDNGTDSGSVYVFDVTTGTQLHKLTASDGAAYDYFATISIDGNYAVIGAARDDDNGSDSGSVYVFDVTTGTQLHKLTASDGAADDWFGDRISIDGNYALIGARQDDDNGSNSGSAYVFDITTGTQLYKLTASDGAADDLFGYIAINGNYAVIGALRDDDNGSNSGSAYIYHANFTDRLVEDTDCYPDPLNIANADDVATSTTVETNTHIISGINGSCNLSIATESSSVTLYKNGAAESNLFTSIENGDSIYLEIDSSGSADTTVNTIITAGERRTKVEVTTAP